MFPSRRRWVRKVSSMLTQGALRQRRRRALESVEERRERLARDAERKRMKRMSESAEEAAWRRTVDAMRKKEKRMKERETKAILAQYSTMPAECIKADINSDNEVMMKVVRPLPRKRRGRAGVGDYFISFPEALADVTEFGSGPTPPNLCDLVTGIPGTSRVSSSPGSRCSHDHHDDTIHCFSTGDGAGDGVIGSSNFPSMGTSRVGGASGCCRGVLPVGSSTSKRHHHPRKAGLHASHPHHNRMHISVAHPAPPAGCWCPGGAVMGRGECDVVAGAAAGGGDKALHVGDSVVGPKEDFLDCSPDESLSALSPEVIISEVKPEPLEDEEGGQLSDERIRQAALSLLSPEVIIREVKMGLPTSGSFVGANSHRRPPRMDEGTGQQLRGHWFASSSLSVNAMPAEGGRQDATSASLYSGRPRGDYILSV